MIQDTPVEEMTEQQLDQIMNLLIKTSYEVALNNLLLQHVFTKNSRGTSDQLDTYIEQAAVKIEERLEQEDMNQIQIIKDSQEKLLEKYREQLEQKEQKLIDLEQKEFRYRDVLKKASLKLDELEKIKVQHQNLLQWINLLIEELQKDLDGHRLFLNFTSRNPHP